MANIENIFKNQIKFYPIGGEDGKTIEESDDDIEYTLKYETNDYTQIRHLLYNGLFEEIIIPFIYYKASELIKDEGIGCRCKFNDIKFDFQNPRDDASTSLLSRYLPIRKVLECFKLPGHDEDGNNFEETIRILNHHLETHSCKIKIFIQCYCYLGDVRDISEEEELDVFLASLDDVDDTEPEDDVDDTEPEDVESYKINTCVICLVNNPNILFTDCNHICICSECLEESKTKNKSIKNCSYCRNRKL